MSAMGLSAELLTGSSMSHVNGDNSFNDDGNSTDDAVLYGLFSQTTDKDTEQDDIIVDLNTGSLDPISLKNWTSITEVTEKFTRL